MPEFWLKNTRYDGLPLIRVEVPEGADLSIEYERAGWEVTDPPVEDEAVVDTAADAEPVPPPDPRTSRRSASKEK